MRLRLSALAVLLVPTIAAAHIRITSPTPRSSTDLKERHCGMAGSARANVQTLRPGSSLHLVWDEYIVHPGWFRISFQQNGDTFEIPPVGAGGAGSYPTENLTGKTDPATGSLIIADRIAHGTLSMDVTLPNVECTNCTLQLTQMMTDKPPYSIDTLSNDIYYTCVDLVLSASAPTPDAGGGTGTGPDGGSPGTGGNNGGSTGGGCSVTGSSTGLLALAMVGLLRRRRARRA
jgi:hypothetical protein